MATTSERNLSAARWTFDGRTGEGQRDLTAPDAQIYGELVFGPSEQRARLPKSVYRQLQESIARGEGLDPGLADAIAAAMRDWALERGATHFTHWFQPLTGSTAEKHDSFYSPVGDGTAIAEFSGKELVRGEPDASSFPTGGVRDTFEARGYTAWDPTSPAFVSWTGEALDMKVPLLRSMDAMSKAAIRALRLFGDEEPQRAFTTIGTEQEYFLIDENHFFERPDLVTTGRTLFGASPPKGHELDDHYFGSIPPRVLACMLEVERELARLGVPIKTRHNEVAPAQYEVAPVFENSNLGADHQQLTMQTLKRVARHYGLVCLLHEKPFDGVNGSGKHNNWSISTDSGTNLLDAGDTREEFLRFLFFCTAVIQAADVHQGLLLASCANAGQDHRLGANEAPPGIISIFLGDELGGIFERIERGESLAQGEEGRMGLGTPVLPELQRDTGDRNRTSPFAFTGNKFEFRLLGSSQSPSFPNTVLNTIVAEALDDLSGKLEQALSAGGSLEDVLPDVMRQSYAEHKRIVFNGDNYTEEWKSEAEARGLLNLPDAADSLPQIGVPSSIEVFGRYAVLSEREIESRLEVFLEQYVLTTNIESETAARIARTMLLPAVLRHLAQLRAAGDSSALAQLTGDLTERLEEFVYAIGRLDSANEPREHGGVAGAAQYLKNDVMSALESVREVADGLEKIVADDLWPLPKYSEMLFIK